MDAKSPWTKGHSERVTSYATAIAKAMGLNDNEIETLRIASLLHDIGKIGTYDVILDKPGRLTNEEFSLVKTHPVKGEEILKPIKQLQNILSIVRSHHERLDGNGYPDKLKGMEIPFVARIITVADSFDSMTSDRPYRPSPGKDYAISELKKYRGIQFDIQVVDAFLQVLEGME
jgi:putative nucleotidyltransferase with HDIG domain